MKLENSKISCLQGNDAVRSVLMIFCEEADVLRLGRKEFF